MKSLMDEFEKCLADVCIEGSVTRDNNGGFGIVAPSPSTGIHWSMIVKEEEPQAMARAVNRYLNLIAYQDDSDRTKITVGTVCGYPLLPPVEIWTGEYATEIETDGDNDNDEWAELIEKPPYDAENDQALRWRCGQCGSDISGPEVVKMHTANRRRTRVMIRQASGGIKPSSDLGKGRSDANPNLIHGEETITKGPGWTEVKTTERFSGDPTDRWTCEHCGNKISKKEAELQTARMRTPKSDKILSEIILRVRVNPNDTK